MSRLLTTDIYWFILLMRCVSIWWTAVRIWCTELNMAGWLQFNMEWYDKCGMTMWPTCEWSNVVWYDMVWQLEGMWALHIVTMWFLTGIAECCAAWLALKLMITIPSLTAYSNYISSDIPSKTLLTLDTTHLICFWFEVKQRVQMTLTCFVTWLMKQAVPERLGWTTVWLIWRAKRSAVVPCPASQLCWTALLSFLSYMPAASSPHFFFSFFLSVIRTLCPSLHMNGMFWQTENIL